MPDSTLRDALRTVFGVVARGQTYRNLAYLALAFPLGVLYFTGVALGASVGVGLLVTLVGVPVLVVTIAGVTVIAGFEARLADRFVGVDAPLPEVLRESNPAATLPRSVDDCIEGTRYLLGAPTTWTSVLLVPLKFGYGVLGFVALTTAVTVTASLLATPFVYDTPGVTVRVGGFVVDSLPEAAAAFAAGVLLVFGALHVLNALARLGGEVTAALLDVGA